VASGTVRRDGRDGGDLDAQGATVDRVVFAERDGAASEVAVVADEIVTSNITIIPAQEALLVDAPQSIGSPARWIQDKKPPRRAKRSEHRVCE